ncbi:MAG: hypothetical protein IKX36_00590 [Prevotella sp.]|nr:hypothetical protein [Prevotella sp.]
MKKTYLFLLAGALICACTNKPNEAAQTSENATTEVAENDQKDATDTTAAESKEVAEAAPVAKPMPLADCPGKDKHISVKLSKLDDGQKAEISLDGKVIQTITDELFTDWYDQQPDEFIHFVDADFDGNTDIFLGAGESRTYSTILLWKPDKKCFERYGSLGEPSLQNPVFSAADKAIYNGGSNSASEEEFTKDVWKNGQLKTAETLFCYTNETSKKEYKLYDAAKKLVKASNNLKDMPEEWQNILKTINK